MKHIINKKLWCHYKMMECKLIKQVERKGSIQLIIF